MITDHSLSRISVASYNDEYSFITLGKDNILKMHLVEHKRVDLSNIMLNLTNSTPISI